MALPDFHSRLLTKREEFIEFLKKMPSKKYSGQSDLDWLSKQKVHGIYVGGKLEAGFVYEALPLSKTFQDIPIENRESLLIQHCRQPESAMGLTCFWFAGSEHKNLVIRYTWVILFLSLFLGRRKSKFVLFSTSDAKLNFICEKLGLERIFFKSCTDKSRNPSSTYMVKTSWFNFLKFIKFIFIKPSWADQITSS